MPILFGREGSCVRGREALVNLFQFDGMDPLSDEIEL